MTKWKVRRHQQRKAWVADPPGHDRTNRNAEWQSKGGKSFHYGYSGRGEGKTSAEARKEAFAHARAQARKVTVTIPERESVLELVGIEYGPDFENNTLIIRSLFGGEIYIPDDYFTKVAAELLLLAPERNFV